MLNKKLLLGSLAGATLMVGALVMMPSIAEAGLVTGSCVNCHTMHNSNDGGTMSDQAAGSPANDHMLRRNCVGCHGYDVNVASTGRAANDPKAPQVNSSIGGNAAGYFDTAKGENSHSLAASTGLTFAGTPASLATAPGSTFAQAGLTCEVCHAGATGAHHKSSGAGSFKAGTSAETSYRMLGIDADSITAGAAGPAMWVASNGIAAPDANYNVVNSYLASTAKGMNIFCANCHADFHGGLADATIANTKDATSGKWVRHPTDVTAYTYINSVNPEVPVGATAIAAANANQVMCISCHRAHGGPYEDLLRFSYAANKAGGTTKSSGCETCHGAK